MIQNTDCGKTIVASSRQKILGLIHNSVAKDIPDINRAEVICQLNQFAIIKDELQNKYVSNNEIQNQLCIIADCCKMKNLLEKFELATNIHNVFRGERNSILQPYKDEELEIYTEPY